jgi:cell division protein FtsB
MINREKSVLLRFFTGQIFVTLVCLTLLFVIVRPMIVNIRQKKRVNQEIDALKTEVAKAETKNTDFQKMLDYLQSDQFVEEQARLNLGMKRDGEKVAVVQDGANQTEEVAVPPQAPVAVDNLGLRNNFGKWIKYFFDNHQLLSE